MTVIPATQEILGTENKPDWCRRPHAGYFRLPPEGGEHDCHFHDYNELYLISGGRAKIVNGGVSYYVKTGDIVCIKAGDEHDILEVYGNEGLELFWVYEPGPPEGRFGHLHRSAEKAKPHPVPTKPVPPDFPV
jgi:mannose-6-phosphate isomerase-like protein (cupin superfamily)